MFIHYHLYARCWSSIGKILMGYHFVLTYPLCSLLAASINVSTAFRLSPIINGGAPRRRDVSQKC